MPLPHDYSGQSCSLARALEIVGERWTLLIVRDAFYGVRRFDDFASHLSIPRAVLSERLKSLTAAGVFDRVGADGTRHEYELTAKGVALWPALRALMDWGDDHYAPEGPRRIVLHATDGARIDRDGHCSKCGASVEPADLVIAPGPGLVRSADQDRVTTALAGPHRVLEPLPRPAPPAPPA
jgi:DNA-binding HxlR family transcriptional regulator